MKYIYILLIGILNFDVSASEQTKTFQGYFTWGHEVEVFKPCNSSKVFWVVSSKEIYDDLVNFHQKVTTKPYEKIYVEVTGFELNEAIDGFSEAYDGYLKVTSVNKKVLDAPLNCK